MGFEQRKFKRAKFEYEILYPTIIFKNDKKTFYDNVKMFTSDISEAGICLISSFYIPTDSFVSFYLRIDDNIPFKVLVKIRWNKLTGGYFTCGGEFIGLRLDEIYKIRNFIDNYTQ